MRMSSLALVGGAFLVVFGVGGLRLIFGVWMRPLEVEFGVDRATMGLLGALAYLVFGLFQPLFGRVVDLHGPRLVVPGAVLLSGIGAIAAAASGSFLLFALAFLLIMCIGFAGAANATIAATVVQRFDRHQGLIFGICSAGGPLGEMVLAYTAALGVESIGWRTTMMALGIALLVAVLPIAWLLLGRTPAPKRTVLPSFGQTFGLALRARGFVLLFCAYFICGVTTLGLIHTHLVPYGIDIGLPEVSAARVLGLVGLFNVVSLVLGGRIADRWGGRGPLIGVFMVRAVALLWLSTATTEPALWLFALIFGLTDMATIPLSAAATSEMFGPRMLGVLMGLLVVAHQIGSALGSYLGGLGYEVFGGYSPVMLAAVGVALTGALLCFAMDTRRVLDERGRGGQELAPSGA
ncbi:MAG: MFS transporter [Chloroflexi bacterium]|nr:MFS transporter [Chloroflexota bacterium]